MIVLIRKFVDVNRKLSNKLVAFYPRVFGGSSYFYTFEKLINSFSESPTIKEIMEIGGGDRPLNIRKVNGLDIAKIDNPSNLYKCYYCQSVEDTIPGKYDLIYSMTLLEHVPNNIKSVVNIYDALNTGGKTVHYIPSKFHPYSLLLRLIGPKLQFLLIRLLRPDAIGVSGYPAFFNYCSPIQMEELFKSTGFKNVEIWPYYRANDYFAFFIPAFILVSIYENVCKFFKFKSAASGFIVVAEKGDL